MLINDYYYNAANSTFDNVWNVTDSSLVLLAYCIAPELPVIALLDFFQSKGYTSDTLADEVRAAVCDIVSRTVLNPKQVKDTVAKVKKQLEKISEHNSQMQMGVDFDSM